MPLKDLIKKYYSIISYIFFGGCTTVINLFLYWLLYSVMGIANVPSTMVAWLLAVLFAFITNKLWVFESKSFVLNILWPELVKFFACRIATGALDVAIMWLSVDLMHWNAMFWKIISNVLVIILNYAASKVLIFVKKEK